MYKTFPGMTPEYLGTSSVLRDDPGIYRLSNDANKLMLPQPRTDDLKNSFLYTFKQAELWNSLPSILRLCTSPQRHP